jgi:hypothetical protein
MTRLPDWRPRLADYIAATRRRPFKYGEQDCAMFAAGAVRAMTGHDPLGDLSLDYSTYPGGIRVLRRQGHADHIALARALLPEIPVAEARMGDLAVLPGHGGEALGLVGGATVLAPGEDGLRVAPLTDATTAFKV